MRSLKNEVKKIVKVSGKNAACRYIENLLLANIISLKQVNKLLDIVEAI